ncbi:hypothetical protein RJ55_06743 [Drechmeria coniospora]|nr:hypothetical protein RJ55_06743 [Drechmeria coniospora]
MHNQPQSLLGRRNIDSRDDFTVKLNCLEEEFAKIRSTISMLLKQNQPSQQTALATPSPRTRSQRSGLSTAPDWAVQIKDAFERWSREIADLRRIATASTSGPNDDNPGKSEDSHQTNLNIRAKQPEPNTNGNVAILHAADEPWSISSEPSSAGDDGDSESSSTHETDDSERIDEGDMTRPKPSQFHLTQGDMGRNLIPNIVRCREDSLFAGKLTADLPRVDWSEVLESLSSITGDGHQLGVRFRARKGFTNLWIAALPPGSLRAMPVPPEADTEYRQGLETFLDNLIEDPPKTEIPYYVGPVPRYEGMLSAGADLEKLPQMDGVNKHYIHIGDKNSGTAFHREDGGLRSCNLTMHGIKVWILIHTDDNDIFERFVRAQARTNNCAQFVRHLSILVPPKALREHGIRFDVCCTAPGEMILTDPGQYHAVINRTSCLAMPINFTLPGDDLGINGLAVCAKCGLYSFSAPGLELVKVDDRTTASETSRNRRSIVPQKRIAEDYERPHRQRTRPDQCISTTIAALKHEERKALQKDKRCSIPKYDADSPPSPNVFKLALALRGRDSVRQLCGLVKQRRVLDIQRPQASGYDTNEAGDEDTVTRQLCNSAKLLAQATSMGNMGVLKRRLAQIDHYRIAELARGDRQRISPATSQRIRTVSGLAKETLKYHTQQGRLWAALCDPLPGLLCLIPLYRHGTREQLDVTSGDYTSLSNTEQESLRKLMDDDYGRALCSAAAAFLRSTKGDTADIEFLWENHPDVCMDTCDEQVMLRLVKAMPYQDENVWVPGKFSNWTRPPSWPEAWSWPADPTSTPHKLSHPRYCEGTDCDCLGKIAISTPLIRSYGKKGRGLQAVAGRPGTVAYKKGEILGVLTDEPVVCQIRSDKYVTAVVALRDIMDGEEITVSYGLSRAAMEEADFIL